MGNQVPDCEVVKFHGDLNHPEQMVVSESQYEKRLSFTSAMDYKIKGELLGSAVLFVGYSFNDSNVAYLFRLLNEHLEALPGGGAGRRAYITVSEPSDFEIRLFQDRNIEVIPLGSADITGEVAGVLRDVRG